MPMLFDAFVAFLALVWAGLMLLNVSGFISKIHDRKIPDTEYNPKVLVMLPCRGVDATLSDNIKSLKSQLYRNFKLIAIVDSEDDPAVNPLKENQVEYVISSAECSGCSGKVRALATAMGKFNDYDAYAIVDSDVEASPAWLEKLISPLRDEDIGISTAFPLFYPIGGFWSRVKMVWGFVGNGLMESRMTRFGWGGSLAFRKGLLDDKHYERFLGSVSDDIAITAAARDKGLGIYYVNERIAKVNSDDNFSRFREWANRQTALSISGSRKILRYGVIVYSMDILLMASSIVLSVFVTPYFLALLLPFLIGIIKTYRRAGIAYPDLWLIYLFVNFVYLANLLTASRMKSIAWRGRTYAIK